LAVIDVLASLLEGERNSILGFLEESWPYPSRATVELNHRLQTMAKTCHRRVSLLSGMILDLGGDLPPRRVQPEEQYMAFLTLDFIIPKLADEKKLSIHRYESALASLGSGAAPEVTEVLRAHLAEHRGELGVLERAAGPKAPRR
jgi:hypothetical protein